MSLSSRFDGLGLVLPGCHLCLIKLVARVNLLQLELDFVFVGDVDAKVFDANLFVIETLFKDSEVYIAISFGPILSLDELLGMHIKWAPWCVQMLQDLNGLHISVGGVEVIKL